MFWVLFFKGKMLLDLGAFSVVLNSVCALTVLRKVELIDKPLVGRGS